MLKLVAVVVVLGLCYSARLSSPHFDSFMQIHGREYETEVEHNIRYWTFYKNMAKWELMAKMERGTATYGMNQFSDLTEEEFTALYLSAPVSKNGRDTFSSLKEAEELDVSKAPTEIDWREKNAVTPVKNQGECGSCWAFSTTGNIEARWAIKNGTLYSLSEQELVDCDVVDQGCNGGLPYQAYSETMRLGGLVQEKDYPYTGTEQKCTLDESKIVAKVTGREKVSTDEDKIAAYVAANGPVSIGINANAMQFYTGGVAYPWTFLCNPYGLNHGVLIAGYGVDGKDPYWLIKNSWGTGWGEKGYYRLHRGAGCCGVNQMVTSAIV